MKLAKGLYKTAKAGVIGSTDIEIMVKGATNLDPFGPAGTTLSELSDLVSKNPEYRQEALQTLLTRLKLPAENWRKIYKALLVIEYLAKNSVKRVVEDLKDPLMFEEIERKVKFKFVDLETGRDEGFQVRAKAAAVVNLLNDAERLGKEREAANTARSRIYGSDTRASADSDAPPPASSTTRGRKKFDIRIKREGLSHSSHSSSAPSTPQALNNNLNNNWNPFQASPPGFQGGQGNMGFQGFQGASDPFAAQGSAGMAASDPFSVMALSSGSGHAAHGLGGAPAAVDMSSPWVQTTKSAACNTPGCTRETWNGQEGEQCCRTCKNSNGKSHGPECEQKIRWHNYCESLSLSDLWDSQGRSDQKLYDVNRNGPEFSFVENLFIETMRNHRNSTITCIQRVENGLQHDAYKVQRRNIAMDITKARDTVSCGTEDQFVKWLFHGTKQETIDNIVNSQAAGYLPMLAGSAVGAILGDGTYFARDAKYSHDYTELTNDVLTKQSQRKMLLNRVIVGEWDQGAKGMKLYPLAKGEKYRQCNSLVNEVENPSIFVIQHSNQAYPSYVITYTSV